ncbi:L,D-transpeptidase family protein [Sporolituus thermophilus]|uniref:Peptidoglycan binding domain-containing protein n=1 Tax=Sporolituus thermophilus DSM 23256 TaxID=1123285 RepID=A0A1G7PGH2_9FIRM|nr:L,D-transpeptidase family protein [Sporolituus thermophilus]SDF84600.1 Putative peptidoglycan binding domain-containing protein [Sporolituus thermophilus DSM 23256]
MNKFFSLKIRRRQLYFGVAALLLGLYLGILGLEYTIDERELAAISNQPTTAPTGTVSIIIKVPERILEVYNDGQLYKKYRVAVGKSKTPTPVGEWKVVWKDYNWGSGFGTRWMGLNVPWGIYGIHGTNNPWSIGRFASHGCIRMRNKDVEELFEWVPIGTEVKIVGPKVKVQRTLKKEMTGADVVMLQVKLKELGYLKARADGIFGAVTEEAVRAFQADKGLEVNGVVNRQMLDLLGI